MGTFLIVLVIVGTMIVLATRLSFYLYKSGALGSSHTTRARRLQPVAVGAVSKGISAIDASSIDLVQIHESKSRRARIVLGLAVLLLVIAIFAIVMISMISAVFS